MVTAAPVDAAVGDDGHLGSAAVPIMVDLERRLSREEDAAVGVDGGHVHLRRNSFSTLIDRIQTIERDIELNFRKHEFGDQDVTEGFFCTYVTGFDGQIKLKDYNLRKVMVYGGFASMMCKGTLFLMDHTVAMMCIQQIFIVLVVAVLGHHLGVLEEDLKAFDMLAKQTGSLVPLILGMYISASLARWWNLREKSIGSIFSCLTDVSMLMVAQRPEPEWRPLHMQLSKFGLASIQLILKAARNHNDFSDLLSNELLTKDEVEYLEQLGASQRPVAVWSWILRVCQFGFVGLPPPNFTPIQMLCTEAKSSIDNIYTHLRTQLPFAYTHLVACLCHAQNVFAAIHAGLKIGLDVGSMEVWLRETCMAVIVCAIYQGLLALTYVIEDPFGDELMDFPVKSYAAYVMASVRAVQEAQWHSPALQNLKAKIEAVDS